MHNGTMISFNNVNKSVLSMIGLVNGFASSKLPRLSRVRI
jgi:hypothetical protein